jgi:peptide/nickel transport system substrate-binding protein
MDLPRLFHLRPPKLTWLRYRPVWWQRLSAFMTTREKAGLGVLVLLMAISAVWAVVGYIDRHTHLIAQSGGIYKEAAVGQPHFLNPILANSNDVDLDISRMVYSPLFRLNSNLQVEKDLAADYSVSPDGKQYTVNLRRDVHWYDGQSLTADDVVFTIRSIQTPDYGSPLQSSFQGVDVQKKDDYTVVFTLKQPYATFLSNLTVGIAPQHVWSNISPKNAALAEQELKPVGSGPFQFTEIKTRRKTGEITEIRLTRNAGYYGQRPYIDEIDFNFYGKHEDAVAALLSGNVDGLGFLPLSLLDKVSGRSALAVHRLLLPQYFALFFNQTQSAVLGDAGIRAALALGTDRQELVKTALHGQGESLHLPIPPGVFAFNEQLPPPPYDPEKAKQNLDDAGWKVPAGKDIREKDGKPLQVKLTTTDWPEYAETADLIKEQWHKIGVDVVVTKLGAGTIQQEAVAPRNYEILLYGEVLPAQPDPYPFWHSSQIKSPGLNLALFQDKDTDKVLEDARKTTDSDQRRDLYLKFQERVLALNPAIILYRPYYLFVSTKGVHGIDTESVALPSGRFADISSWYVKTKRIWN